MWIYAVPVIGALLIIPAYIGIHLLFEWWINKPGKPKKPPPQNL